MELDHGGKDLEKGGREKSDIEGSRRKAQKVNQAPWLPHAKHGLQACAASYIPL